MDPPQRRRSASTTDASSNSNNELAVAIAQALYGSTTNAKMVELQKLGPRPFKGDSEVVETKEWLRLIEKTFDLVECNDKEKVCYAVYMLQGEADAW